MPTAAIAVVACIMTAFLVFSFALMWGICKTRDRPSVARPVHNDRLAASPLTNVNAILIRLSGGMVVFCGLPALIATLLLAVYLCFVVMVAQQWGLKGLFFVAAEMWVVACVFLFFKDILRTATFLQRVLLISCVILIVIIGLLSDVGTAGLVENAKTSWEYTLLGFLWAMLFGMTLGQLNRCMQSLSDNIREFISAICFAVLVAVLWLWNVGSYNVILDIVVATLSFALTALYMGCRLRRFENDEWPRDAAVLTVAGVLCSWVAFSAVDRFLPAPALPTQPERFEALKKADAWPEVRVGLALSGGGYRAALVHAGVLHALEAMNVRVSNLATVSGGSIIGSYYAAGGDPHLFAGAVGHRSFNLFREIGHVENLFRILPGLGLLDRTDIQAGLLDRVLLHGWRVADTVSSEQPRLILGATDLRSGLIVGLLRDGVLLRELPAFCDKQECVEDFPAVPESTPWFVPRAQGGFPADDRMADLVAISGGFPIAFPPKRVTVKEQINDPFESNSPIVSDRSLVLSDGGLADNFGVRIMLDARDLARNNEPRTSRDDIFSQPQATALMDPEWKVDLILVSDGGKQLQDADRVGDWDLMRLMDVVSESAGAPPERRWAQLQLTDRTLMALENDGVPDSVLNKLRAISANFTSYSSERSFLAKMKDTLTPAELNAFSTKLLYHARNSRVAPLPNILELSTSRLVFRKGSPALREIAPSQTTGRCSDPRRRFALAFPDIKKMTESERKQLVDLLPETVAREIDLKEFSRLVAEDAKERARPVPMGGPMLSPNDSFYETDADRMRETIFHKIYDHLEGLFCDFTETATLKDAYTPDEAEALFTLGGYMVLLRWPEIKDALDRARDGKQHRSL